ncbi:hypothetical protein C8R44DRAFT_895489 [Mycena epipterygia]|nr:hypothetical protein C8R44DRAFT_895489 [Mycena epipterygia]
MALVEDLRHRGLVAVVKRLVVGPNAWHHHLRRCDPNPSTLPSHNIRDFEAEVLEGGEHANNVLYVDKETLDPGFVEDQRRDERMYVIIDWRAQQYCEILPPGRNFRVKLIPGYLILTWTSGMLRDIRLVAITSLSGSWTPVAPSNTANPVQPSNIPHVASHTVKVKGSGGSIQAVVTSPVYEDPLHCGSYRLWLSIPYTAGTSRGQFTIRPRSRAFATTNTGFPGTWEISYSGHAKSSQLLDDKDIHRIFPPDNSTPINLAIPEASRTAYILPYNGTVALVTARPLVLSYFE